MLDPVDLCAHRVMHGRHFIQDRDPRGIGEQRLEPGGHLSAGMPASALIFKRNRALPEERRVTA